MKCSDCGSAEGVVVWDKDREKYVHWGVCFWSSVPAEVPC